AQLVREGTDVLLISMGSISAEVVKTADALATQGISAQVLVVASIHPTPVDDLATVLMRFKLAISIEAHHEIGGIGSLVSEVIAERGLDCRLVRCGVKSMKSGVTGNVNYLHRANGLSCDALVKTVIGALNQQ